ncbi:MAG: alpha/beta fold hydrolase [Gammaproteobacteria bacterium]
MIEEFSSSFCVTPRHTTHYLASGPEQGPLIVFIHGWPELSYSWRAQLAAFGKLGFRAVAPDLRGYGKSSVYTRHADYAQSEVVADMLELLDHFGRDQAIWVGHDWGSPTAWLMASHHPDKTLAVANLCVPYAVLENGLDTLIDSVNRNIYPEDQHPAGQWDYQLFYEENFDRATEVFAANPRNTLTALFRAWSSDGIGQPAITAGIRAQGGWFGGADAAPEMPLDTNVLSEDDLAVYIESLTRNGFFGPDSYYMNHAANAEFSSLAKNDGVIELPALFLAARYDFVCETIDSRLAEPMRAKCTNLTEQIIDTGHWMAQEKPEEVNAALQLWIETKVTGGLP